MGIKRREFLKAGAATATVAGAAGVGGLAGSACGGLFDRTVFDDSRLPLPDMDAYLRKIDDGMGRIAKWDRRDDIPMTELDQALDNDLGRQTLRALYMTGMFGDLPDAGQVHPGMQERIEQALPEMKETVATIADLLSNLSDEDVENLQRFVKDRDDPGMGFAQWLDDVESVLGVSPERRLQTRALVTKVISRLKNQSPRMLFDEYIGKVERIEARTGSLEEIEREMIARIGEQAFWERQQRLATYAAAWTEQGAVADNLQLERPPLTTPTGPTDTHALPPVQLPPTESEPSDVDAGVEPVGAGPVAGPGSSQVSNLVDSLDSTAPPVPVDPAVSPQQPSIDWWSLDCDEVDARIKQELGILRNKRDAGLISPEDADRQAKAILWNRRRQSCAKQSKRTGAYVCLGIGAAFAVTSIVLFAVLADPFFGWIPGAIAATPAVVLLIVGLVLLAYSGSR
jgi:hypothetical protein